jgi:hypothetical protein
LNVALGILAGLVLLGGVYLVSTRAIALWYFYRSTADDVRASIAWDPRQAMYYAALARVLERSPQGGDPDEIISLYEKATQQNPYRARYWAELGGAYELAGRLDEALTAYEQAQRLFPNSPEINWQLGNFYIRRGDAPAALRAFRKVLLGDPALQQQVFALAWRLDPGADQILAEMIPEDKEILFRYLNYLVAHNLLQEAGTVWARILALKLDFEPRRAFPYLDALIRAQQVDAVVAAWTALEERNSALISPRVFEDNLITNGSFENLILNGGLDWRVIPQTGVVVRVDSTDFFDGTHSLEIRFEQKQNVHYRYVFQYVPVKPNTLYRFVGYMRTQGITTDSGPRFQLYDAADPSKLSLSTENLVGTSSWQPEQLEFQTGPDTRLLTVRVARPPSTKFDNQIEGSVWIDRLSLISVE